MLIYSGISVYERSQRITEVFETEQEKTVKNLQEYEITKYDGYKINGSTAITYLKNVVQDYTVPVTVITSEHDFVVEDDSVYGKLRDMQSDFYINPLEHFLCNVYRDVNDSITGVTLKYVP